MKLYTALVNTTLKDGSHNNNHIRLLIKRHRSNSSEPWTYTALVEYHKSFEDLKNPPFTFESNLDWELAARRAFENSINGMINTVIEFVRKVDF